MSSGHRAGRGHVLKDWWPCWPWADVLEEVEILKRGCFSREKQNGGGRKMIEVLRERAIGLAQDTQGCFPADGE